MTTPITTTADRLLEEAESTKADCWSCLEVDADVLIALCSAIKEMAAEHEEDQGVIAVWRRRTAEAEAERDALRKALAASKVVIEGQDRRSLAAAEKVAPLVAAAADVAGERAANEILTAEVDRLRAELEAVKADASSARGQTQWRLLTAGELIQADDEGLQDDCVTWLPMAGWEIDMSYSPAFLVPIRRRVTAIDAAMNDRKEG